jgi:ribosome-binding protein aMBF1 (putative translation factor)
VQYRSKAKPSAITQRLLDAKRELDERLAVEMRRDGARVKLMALVRRYELTASDLHELARSLKRTKGDAPVSTKSPNWKGGRPLPPPKGAVGTAIRKARLAKKLSTAQLGEAIDIHHSTINHWESRGAIPRPNLYASLKRSLGVDVEAILAKQGKMNGAAGAA